MPTPIGREVIEGVRRFKGYRERLQRAISAEFYDATVGLPFKLPSLLRGDHFEVPVYSNSIKDVWYVMEMPKVKAVLDDAKNCGTPLELLFNDRDGHGYARKDALSKI